ncbi:amino acid transmembrane transporter protein [Trichomonas vaginalis G3]|nr:amino acid transmembrane transporter protein [Trichomonas vaginalis G3]KAI5499567.1 amino acid transmembrane transporter protein [Trichomonas vaginalis G3]
MSSAEASDSPSLHEVPGEVPEVVNSYSTSSDVKSSSDDKKDAENPDADLDEEKEKANQEETRVGRFATIINLLNSLLGASIFTLPGKFGEVGIIPSIVLLAFAAYIAYVCSKILVKIEQDLEGDGLDDIALKVFGHGGQVFVSIISLIFCIASNIAYVVISCDVIQQWIELSGITVAYWIRVGITFAYSVVPVGLAIPKSLKFLSYFSSLTIGIMLFYILVVIIKFPTVIKTMDLKDPSFSLGRAGLGIFSALSMFFLNFTLPITTLPIVNKYNKDLRKRYISLLWTCASCLFILVIPSILGYMMVFNESESKLIFSYEKFQKDVLFNILKAGCFLAVTCSYPVLNKPIMGAWSQLFFKINDPDILPVKKLAIVHVVAHTIPVCIGAFYPKIMDILDYTGSFGCIINVTIPGLLWYIHYKPKVNSFYFWGCWFLTIFGIFLAIAIIAMQVKSMVK